MRRFGRGRGAVGRGQLAGGAHRLPGAADLHIEPDASAATYLWAAEALTGGAIDLACRPRCSPSPTPRAWKLIRRSRTCRR